MSLKSLDRQIEHYEALVGRLKELRERLQKEAES